MQSTQSSQPGGTVFFRAVVMVGFLAVIFYVALSGNALPDAVRKKIEAYLPKSLMASNSTTEDASPAPNAGEAPLFNAPNYTASIGSNAARSMPFENQGAPRQLVSEGSASMRPVRPMESVPPTQRFDAPSQGFANPAAVVPVNYQTPADASSLSGGQFSQVQDRLKQLGATYFLLETWGNQQQLYRFYCKMAVGGNTNYTHCFEQIGPDPLQTMSEVLKQVEAWRNGGSVVQ
jgi:hypothetical protein